MLEYLKKSFARLRNKETDSWKIDDDSTNNSETTDNKLPNKLSQEHKLSFISSAFEYSLDPSSKKTFIIVSSIFCTTILILTIIIVTVVATPDDKPNSIISSKSKALSSKYNKFETKLRGTSDPSMFKDPYSPQKLALDWLVLKDDNINSNTIIQRYVLVTLYYSFEGDNWFSSTNWLNSEKHECHWKFVLCDGNEVISLDLSHNNVKGVIPSEIGVLSMLG